MQISKVTLRAARELGLRPLLHLGTYRLQEKTGWLRRQTPVFDWASKPLSRLVKPGVSVAGDDYVRLREGSQGAFFFRSIDALQQQLMLFHGSKSKAILSHAEQILDGIFPLFGEEQYDLGFPPAWNRFPVSDRIRVKPDRHWTRYDLDNQPYDIKFIWEPSRFNWAYYLLRAFHLTKEDHFAEGFWILSESWKDENPPNAGPQWISAQEVAIRVLALIFCFYGFFDLFKVEPERIADLACLITIHAERIPYTLAYSRAQGNNHLLLEAVALYSVGLLFPEFRGSDRWRQQGWDLFNSGIIEQVYSDGGYVQHSSNYHRFALASSLWFLQLAKINNDEVPTSTVDAITSLADCLSAFVDPMSGRAFNFGHNDGALLFPLSSCSYHDYRPTIRLATSILGNKNALTAGPWDELLLWFGTQTDRQDGVLNQTLARHKGSDAVEISEEELPKKPRHLSRAGIVLLEGEGSRGLLRCAQFTNRPAHSDQLHLSVQMHGENVLLDPGTYLYNGTPPWQNILALSTVHNSPIVDGYESMVRAGTFLWLDWSTCVVTQQHFSSTGSIELVTAFHDGYRRLGISVSRSVLRLGGRSWIVVDEVKGSGDHTVRTGWLFPDSSFDLSGNTLQFEVGGYPVRVEVTGQEICVSLFRAGECIEGRERDKDSSIMGWTSPTYARKIPALHLVSNVTGNLPIRIQTKITMGDEESEEAIIQLSELDDEELKVRSITYQGDELRT